ncbi:MAG: ABC transporter ATP-binding protein [Lachnospiraceae bacterium]|nr:ABC transporter ATP-binding protein [uncultured Acetatifactor sp.]MCI9231902.1 ABC transporter ATP-binding protein [Lachnospiraceae bacterium]
MDKSTQKQRAKEYIREFYRNNRANFTLAVIAATLSSGMQVGIAYLLKELTDVSMSGDLGTLAGLVRTAVAFLLLTVGIWLLDRRFRHNFIRKAVEGYRNKAFDAITSKGIASFGKENTSSYISALTNDVNSIEANYLTANFTFLTLTLQAVASVGLMLWYSWPLTLTVMALGVLLIAASLPFGNRIAEQERKVSEKNAGFLSMVKDLLSGLGVIKSFQAQEEAAALYYDRNGKLEQTKCRRRKAAETVNIVSFIGSFTVQMGVFCYGAYLSIQGRITPGVVIAFVQMMNYIISPIQQLPGLLANRKAAVGLIEKMAVYGEDISSGANLEKLETVGDGIRFEHVDFAYAEGADALKDVSVRFEAGKSYAIVGGSGSGKSTLLNLIMGSCPGYRGSVTVGGKEISRLQPDSIFDVISVIQQNVFIFDDTIARNICMFREFDREQVDWAVNGAGLSGLMDEKGEEYVCGEGGACLSGGERQRIAIARSLLRNSPVLLVDEATSALDAETADSVTDSILNIQGLTRLVVTHRLDEKTLSRFDGIVVMKNGRITEQGTFQELMEQRRYFYSLYMVSREA